MYGHGHYGVPPQGMQQQQPPGSSSPNPSPHPQQQQQQLPSQQSSARSSSASMQQQQQHASQQPPQSQSHNNNNSLSHSAASPLDYPHSKQPPQPPFSHSSQPPHPSHPSLHSGKSTHPMATADIAAYYNLINSSHAPSNASHSLPDMRNELANNSSGGGSRAMNGGNSAQSVSHINPLSLLLSGGQLPPSLLNQSNGSSSAPGSGLLSTPSGGGSGASASVTSRQVQQLHNAQALQAAQAMLTNSNMSGADGMDTSLFQYPPMPSTAAASLPGQSKQYGSQPVSPSLMSPYMEQYTRSLQNDRRQPQSQQHHHQQQQQQQHQQQHQRSISGQSVYDNRSSVQQLSTERPLPAMYNSSGNSSPNTPHTPHMQLPLTQPHARISSSASASASASASSAHSVSGSSPPPSTSSSATPAYASHLSSLKHELSDLTRRLEQQSADYYSTQREMIEKLAVFSQLMSAMNGAGGGVVGGAVSAMAGRQQQQRSAGMQAHQYLMQGVNALMSGPAPGGSSGGGSGGGGSEPMSGQSGSLYSPAGISRGSSAHSGLPSMHNSLAGSSGLSSLSGAMSNVSPTGLPTPSPPSNASLLQHLQGLHPSYLPSILSGGHPSAPHSSHDANTPSSQSLPDPIVQYMQHQQQQQQQQHQSMSTAAIDLPLDPTDKRKHDHANNSKQRNNTAAANHGSDKPHTKGNKPATPTSAANGQAASTATGGSGGKGRADNGKGGKGSGVKKEKVDSPKGRKAASNKGKGKEADGKKEKSADKREMKQEEKKSGGGSGAAANKSDKKKPGGKAAEKLNDSTTAVAVTLTPAASPPPHALSASTSSSQDAAHVMPYLFPSASSNSLSSNDDHRLNFDAEMHMRPLSPSLSGYGPSSHGGGGRLLTPTSRLLSAMDESDPRLHSPMTSPAGGVPLVGRLDEMSGRDEDYGGGEGGMEELELHGREEEEEEDERSHHSEPHGGKHGMRYQPTPAALEGADVSVVLPLPDTQLNGLNTITNRLSRSTSASAGAVKVSELEVRSDSGELLTPLKRPHSVMSPPSSFSSSVSSTASLGSSSTLSSLSSPSVSSVPSLSSLSYSSSISSGGVLDELERGKKPRLAASE